MTYVVFGATGNTGGIVAEKLLGAGKKVRAVVRDEGKASALKAKGAETTTANLEDSGSIRVALEGASAAYFLVPPNFVTSDFKGYQRRVVDAIDSAARSTGLPEAVLLSSVAAELPSGNGPIQGLYYAEQKFKAGSTRFAFLRAAYFMENLGGSLGLLEQGLFPTFSPKDLAFEMVATSDIGAAAAGILLEGVKETRVVNVTSGRHSASDVARALGELLGKKIEVAEAPASTMAGALEGFGLPKEMAGLYQEMTEGMNAGKINFEAGVPTIQGQAKLVDVLRRLLGK